MAIDCMRTECWLVWAAQVEIVRINGMVHGIYTPCAIEQL